MILNIYAVYDIKAQAYSNPFFLPHNGQALRGFSDHVQDEKSAVAKHPEDYKLYQLGTFDDVSGLFTAEKVPVFLANASDFVAINQQKAK